MERIKRILLVLLISIPFISVNASCINSDGTGKDGSVSLSATSLNVTVGKTTTFKINAPCAAGKFVITSSNTSVASVTPDSEFLDDSSLTVTVKGKAVGTATINVSLEDVADYASNVIQGTKRVTINVKAPVTTTKATTRATTRAATNPTTKGTTKPTTKATTKPTEPTTKLIKPIKINTFDIVGYDVQFDMNTFEYTIDVGSNVKELYIITTGENFKVDGDKEVNIEGKDSINVTFTNEDNQLDYKININRVGSAIPTETKEEVKEVVKTNNTFLYTTVCLGILSAILAILLVKSKNEKKLSSNNRPIVEKEITPIETTHINNINPNTVSNVYTNTATSPVNQTPIAQPQNTITNPLDNMYIQPETTTPINSTDNNLK